MAKAKVKAEKAEEVQEEIIEEIQEVETEKPVKTEKKTKVIPLKLHKEFCNLYLKKLSMTSPRDIKRFKDKYTEKFEELEKEVKQFSGKLGNLKKKNLMKVSHKGSLYFITRDYPNPIEVTEITALKQYIQ